MYSQKSNFCLSTLTEIIGEEILYFVTCKKKRWSFRLIGTTSKDKENKLKSKDKKAKEDEYVEEILFICEESIKFIGSDYSKVKREFKFNNIESLNVSGNKGENCIFCLKEGIKKNKKKSYEFTIFNNLKFIEILNGKYKMYAIRKNIKEIYNVNYKIIEMKDNSNESKDKKIKYPGTLKIYHLGRYKFRLNELFEQSNSERNTFIYEQDKQKEDIIKEEEDSVPKTLPKISISIYIQEEQPVEFFSMNSNKESIKICSYNAFYNYVTEILGLKNGYHVKPVIKTYKNPEGEDISLWRCYIYNLKTKCINHLGFNLYYFYIRRSFIPPFFESFNDIAIVLKEEYRDDSSAGTEFSELALASIRDLYNSFCADDLQKTNSITEQMITEKLDSYLVYSKNLKYFYEDLGILGNNSIKLALAYKIRLALFYNDYDNKLLKEYGNDIKKCYKEIEGEGQELNFEKYYQKIKNMTREQLLEKYTSEIKKYLKYEDKNAEIIHKQKIIQFLGDFVMQKKFIPLPIESIESVSKTSNHDDNDKNEFQKEKSSFITKLIDLSKRSMSFKKKILPELKFLLNISIITETEEVLIEQSINDVINNQDKIFLITYNEKLLLKLIREGKLQEVEEVSSEVFYYQFLNIILSRNFSIKLLKSIYEYFINFCGEDSEIDGEKNSANSESVKRMAPILLETFMNLYSDESMNPQVTIYSCKCISFLAKSDPSIRDRLTEEEFAGLLYHHFSSPNEAVVFNSIKLFQIITYTNFNLNKMIHLHKGFLFKLINILKGTGIDGCFTDPELTYLVIDYLSEKFDYILIQRELLSEKNRKFIKYLFPYIGSFEKCFDKTKSYQYYFNLQTVIFKFLTKIVKTGPEIRKYIEDNYNLTSVIDQEAEFYVKILENQKNSGDNGNRRNQQEKIDNAKEKEESIMLLMKNIVEFLNDFITEENKEIKDKIRIIGKGILSFVQVIKEKYKKMGNDINKTVGDTNAEKKELKECKDKADTLFSKLVD